MRGRGQQNGVHQEAVLSQSSVYAAIHAVHQRDGNSHLKCQGHDVPLPEIGIEDESPCCIGVEIMHQFQLKQVQAGPHCLPQRNEFGSWGHRSSSTRQNAPGTCLSSFEAVSTGGCLLVTLGQKLTFSLAWVRRQGADLDFPPPTCGTTVP